MSLKEILKGVAVGSFLLAFTPSVVFLMNVYSNHNINYTSKSSGTETMRKIDGIISYTELEKNKDGSINIDRFSFGVSKFYTDKNGDLRVDRVSVFPRWERSSADEFFYRDKHLQKYPEVFEAADIDFREQMKRFGQIK